MESIESDDVLRGPSGHHIKTDIVMMDGVPFIDDTLTEHELDIVCGVYRNLGSAYANIYRDIHILTQRYRPGK